MNGNENNETDDVMSDQLIYFLTFLFEQFILAQDRDLSFFLVSVLDLIGNNYFQNILDKNDCFEKYFSSFQNSTPSHCVCLDNSQLYNSLKYYAKIFL